MPPKGYPDNALKSAAGLRSGAHSPIKAPKATIQGPTSLGTYLILGALPKVGLGHCPGSSVPTSMQHPLVKIASCSQELNNLATHPSRQLSVLITHSPRNSSVYRPVSSKSFRKVFWRRK